MKQIISSLLLVFSASSVLADDVIPCDSDASEAVESSFMQLAQATVSTCATKLDQEAKYKKQKFDFNVCNSGKFELEMETFFPYAASVEDVFSDYFLNGENIKKTSNLLQDTAPKIWVDGKVYTGKAAGLKGKAYTIETHPEKSFSTKNFYSGCSLAPNGASLTQTCNVSLTKGDAKEAFEAGKTNSTTTKCTKVPVGVKCVVTVKGSPKSINGILYRNTAEKLAVSGAIEAMRDIYNLSYLAHGCAPGAESENVTTSNFFKNNIDPFWEKVTSKVENLSGSKSLVSVSSGLEAISVKTFEDTKDWNEKNVENKILSCP
jgi:hypothetical protein